MATSDMQMSLGQEDDKLVMNWLRTTGVEMEVIAESTGLNVSSLQKIRRGQTKKPHPSTIQKLRQCMTSDRMQRTSPPSLSLEAGGGEYFTAPEIRGTTVQNHLSPPDTISPESLRHPRYDPPEHHVPNQEIFIPVHGFVWLTESELKVVDHPAFQRLRRVRQLGMAHMVYPGATHTRYEHVLGVLHITSEVIKAIQGNHERAKSKDKLKDPSDSSHWGLPLGARESAFCRLAALLHDIGHLPFGHSIEDELSILNHHDKEDRLALILLNWKASELNSQFLGQVIDELYTFDTPIQLESINRSITPTELVISIILHEPPRSVTANYRTLLEERRREDDDSWPKKEDVVRAFAADLAKVDVRLEVCADIVGNTICADLLDYLHRDWHHVGKSKFLDDRVLHYMEIRKDPSIQEQDVYETVNPADRLVLNLGRYPRMRTDAVSLILELLESRYNLAEAVLFHRSKLKLTAMLERCLAMTFHRKSTSSGKWWDDRLELQLLTISEDGFMDELCEQRPSFQSTTLSPTEAKQRWRLANCIRDRSLFRHVHTIPMSEGPAEALMRCQEIYTAKNVGAAKREESLRQVETDFALERGELVMYCPNSKMNSKIAEVKVLVGGELHQLDAYDKESIQKLAAGHLAAQIERFKKLWLITFLVDPAVQIRLGFNDSEFKAWRRLLADYIEAFVVGTSRGRTIDQARAEIVDRMAHNDLFLRSHKVGANSLHVNKKPQTAAARGQDDDYYARATKSGAPGVFPTGAHSFWKYVIGKNNDAPGSPTSP